MLNRAEPSMSLEELALFNELFASRYGLFFPEHKREILASRLAPRLVANHLRRYLDYYLLLSYDLAREQDALIRSITNNESYFFRETSQFEALATAAPTLCREGPLRGRLRILSAGCSSGEEPYTLRMYDRLHRFGGAALAAIDAVDIDTDRIEMAKQAVYRRSSLRAIPEGQIVRYFQNDDHDDERFVLRDVYREQVRFAPGNLVELDTLRQAVPYDVIFCRNVLIYFAEPALKRAIDNFAQLVRPGGLLFLGHSESIIGLTAAFQAERFPQCIGYRRVAA